MLTVPGLVAGTANLLAAVFLLPQLGRLIRRADVAGVSIVWAAFGLVTNAAWVFYLGRLGLWEAAIAPCLAVVTYGATLGVTASIDHRRAWMCGSGAYAAALTAIAAAQPDWLGWVLSITPAVQLTPAIVAAFRHRCPSGVSPATWSMAVAEAGLWGLYGWMVGDAALVGYGLVTSAGSVLILGRSLTTPSRGTHRPRLRVGAA